MITQSFETLLEASVDAFDRVAESNEAEWKKKRWHNAIAKAWQELQSNNPYMHFDGESLLVLSSSGEIYEANGTCSCKAYLNGFPCWHRAAARILKRVSETSH